MAGDHVHSGGCGRARRHHRVVGGARPSTTLRRLLVFSRRVGSVACSITEEGVEEAGDVISMHGVVVITHAGACARLSEERTEERQGK